VADGEAVPIIRRGPEKLSGVPQQATEPGTASRISATWRGPDCGTQKMTFRPHPGPPIPAYVQKATE
jgi:rubredoxin